MMLKQSGSSRIQRSKTLKVKHALQICVILTICIWFLYQVKKSHSKKAALEKRRTTSGEDEYKTVKMGRKDFKPRLEEFEQQGNEEGEAEDEYSRVKGRNGDRDEEIGLGDTEKSEDVEHDQLQDLMDNDVKETDFNKLL